MGDYKEKIKVTDKPILADANWKELKNVRSLACGFCESKNTFCIYHYSAGCIIGATVEEEFYCKDCGKFTSYYLDYES